MQTYLGICDNHDSGACVFKESELKFAVNEERLIREKLTRKFPVNSIKLAMQEIKGKTDIVIASEMTPIFLLRLLNSHYSKIKKSQFSYLVNLYFLYQIFMKKTKLNSFEKILSLIFFKIKLNRMLNGNAGKITLIDHHLAHAIGSYYASGFKNALLISCDAMGDGVTLSVRSAFNSKIKVIHEELGNSAISLYYSRMTEYLGFEALRHEGKILGLAAYGNPKRALDIMNKMLYFKPNGSFNSINHLIPASKRKYHSMLKSFRKEDIAAALQKNLELEFVKFVRFWSEKTGLKDICLSGGIFSNVKLNQKIKEDAKIKNIFIFPHMGDGGLAVGSVAAYLKLKPKKIRNLYLGPAYSRQEIIKSLKNNNLNFIEPKKKAILLAKLIDEGKLIAVFNESMEFGPRALGNRSIICRPDRKELTDLLNKKLKRNDFMPFAPAVLYKYRKKCFKNTEGSEHAAKFMTITFDCTEYMKKSCPAVVHIDGTARPQLVDKLSNYGFYSILDEFYKLSKLPCIVNTSFNMHEDPIVCTPNEAIHSFKRAKLDYLCIGDFLVKG